MKRLFEAFITHYLAQSARTVSACRLLRSVLLVQWLPVMDRHLRMPSIFRPSRSCTISSLSSSSTRAVPGQKHPVFKYGQALASQASILKHASACLVVAHPP